MDEHLEPGASLVYKFERYINSDFVEEKLLRVSIPVDIKISGVFFSESRVANNTIEGFHRVFLDSTAVVYTGSSSFLLKADKLIAESGSRIESGPWSQAASGAGANGAPINIYSLQAEGEQELLSRGQDGAPGKHGGPGFNGGNSSPVTLTIREAAPDFKLNLNALAGNGGAGGHRRKNRKHRAWGANGDAGAMSEFTIKIGDSLAFL